MYCNLLTNKLPQHTDSGLRKIPTENEMSDLITAGYVEEVEEE